MKCEEFETIGLDAGRDASLSEAERAAVEEHVSSCGRCAALQSSWQEARMELRALAEETSSAQAPARVEMRLRQELRTQHSAWKSRHIAVAAAWTLAAAAVLIGAVSWVKWRDSQHLAKASHSSAAVADNPSSHGGVSNSNAAAGGFSVDEDSVTLVAGNESGNYTLLPGVQPGDIEDSEILRVRMQRSALGAFGLPVNEDLANEWIQVDLVVGDDGSPQAVRLLQE